jgi:hypothetical protein
VVDGQALRRDGVTLSVDETAAGSDLEDVVSDYYSDI